MTHGHTRFSVMRGLLPLLLASFLLLFAVACSDSSTEPDGDEPDGDTSDGDTPDGDEPDGDDTPVEPTTFLLGYAETDITPYPTFDRVLMGSYGIPGIGRAMKGVHDPLLAQVALIANDAGEAMMLISVDLCGYAFEFADLGPGVRELRESIAGALADIFPIEPEQILVAPSHNHTSTDLVGLHWDIGKPMPREQMDWHVTKITETAVQAAQNLADVTLRFSVFDFPEGYAARDEVPVGSGIRCSRYIDNRVHTMQAFDPEGTLLLTVANFAKHPTTINWLFKEASADYIWAYRLEVEEATDSKAMFIQGFEAATHAGDAFFALPGEEDSYEKCENFGRFFAQEVLEHASAESTLATDYRIEHKEEIIALPTQGFLNDVELMLQLTARSVTDGENGYYTLESIPVGWRRIGPAQFVSWPGEAAPEYSLMLRDRMTTEFAFMVGLGNDQIGYFIPPESVEPENDPTGKLADYEARMGPGLGSGEIILEVLESFGFMPPAN